MSIAWVTAFIDLPAETFEAGAEFWRAVTGSELSERRGEDGKFATLLPATGDSHLRVQRVDEGPGGIHLDFHVPDVAAAVVAAVGIGATLVWEDGHAIMTSPGGFTFCFVPHHGESVIPDPIDPAMPSRVDQVCVDVPAGLFDSECDFWAKLTGWQMSPGSLDEYRSLQGAENLPMALLFQRLGSSDTGTTVRAHLDISAGSHGPALVVQHERLGATLLGKESQPSEHWLIMEDPAGSHYCVTGSDPLRGSLN